METFLDLGFLESVRCPPSPRQPRSPQECARAACRRSVAPRTPTSGASRQSRPRRSGVGWRPPRPPTEAPEPRTR
eukprot:3044707-Pyramimonas_sp.AAC.1